MTAEITVCLTNWKRPSLLEDLVASIRQQSVFSSIFLWNNGEDIPNIDVDWLVQSSRNLVCHPRWFMASSANTELVCILDDDMILNDKHAIAGIIELLNRQDETSIVGVEAVNLVEGVSYRESRHIRLSEGPAGGDVRCDIVKGKLMALRTTALRAALPLAGPELYREDDIAVSGWLSGGRARHHLCASSLANRFTLLDAPHSLWREPGHFARRDVAARRFFPFWSGPRAPQP